MDLLIICSAPVFAWAGQQLLQRDDWSVHSQVITHVNTPQKLHDSPPTLLIVAPLNWEEMYAWLPVLLRDFRQSSWLIFTELRVAGLFAASLERIVCTITGYGTQPDELRGTVQSLREGVIICPPTALLTRFSQGILILPSGRQALPLTARELQCGCAISLGLTNHQAATVLSISEGTVKKHIHSLMHKLALSNREQLGELFRDALAPQWSTS